MYYKCELMIGGYVHEVTDELVNWDDVSLSYKRGNYDGVVRSFSTKFEFADSAYSLLLDEYLANYLNSSATIIFYKRNNSWLWSEVFRCALDFSMFSHDGMTCQINAIDDSLASIIKAKKGTQYEYAVSEIREVEPLTYDHLNMTNRIEWTYPSGELEGSMDLHMQNKVYAVPIYVNTAEVVSGSSIYTDNKTGAYEGGDYTPSFFQNTSGSTLTVRFTTLFNLIYGDSNSGGVYDGTLYLHIGKWHNYTTSIYKKQFVPLTYYNVVIDEEITLKDGEALKFYFVHEGGVLDMIGEASTVSLSGWKNPVITYDFQGHSVNIDIVKPVTLLNRLLKSMNGGKDGITGEIADTDERLNSTMLMAADSARGLNGAKMYSSYTKFCNWMSAEFGFVPVIGDNKVSFVHRDSLFTDSEVKALGNDCTEFEHAVDSGLIHSRISIGYDKVDYDSVNGKDEFRFTNQYTTGVTLTDSTLELISPYRADAYGIEFLVNKRGEDTTDDSSDNDVFMVGVSLNGEAYTLIRSGYTVEGVISPETMFNAMYAHRFMIEANSKYIGVSCNGMEYASSDGNSEVTVNGVAQTADFTLSERLFTASTIQVASADMEIPSDLTGYLTVQKNGHTYTGYLKDVTFGVGRDESVKYDLIVRSVE